MPSHMPPPSTALTGHPLLGEEAGLTSLQGQPALMCQDWYWSRDMQMNAESQAFCQLLGELDGR